MKSFALSIACAISLIAGCGSSSHDHPGHSGYEQISLDSAPDAVRDAVRRDYPKAQVRHVGREFYDKEGTAHFHVMLTTADGKRQSVEYDESGERIGAH